MNKIEIPTYGEAADFVTHCDEDDIQIYTMIMGGHRIPVDNYLLFKDCTTHAPDDYFPMDFFEIDDGFLIN